MSDVLQVLRQARELISDPKHWTQKACARDVNGEHIDIFSPDAVCFCVGGAIERVSKTGCREAYLLLDQVAEKLTDEKSAYPYLDVNDKLGHEATLVMLDGAIELAAKQSDATGLNAVSDQSLATNKEGGDR
jgi:hypothetical protein